MTDLEAIKAELERQDRELAAAFEQLRAQDPDAQFLIPTELLEQIEAAGTTTTATPPTWLVRG